MGWPAERGDWGIVVAAGKSGRSKVTPEFAWRFSGARFRRPVKTGESVDDEIGFACCVYRVCMCVCGFCIAFCISLLLLYIREYVILYGR